MDICALNFQLLGSVYIFFSLTLSASGYDSFVYIYICFNIHRYIYIYVKYNLLDYYIDNNSIIEVECSKNELLQH